MKVLWLHARLALAIALLFALVYGLLVVIAYLAGYAQPVVMGVLALFIVLLQYLASSAEISCALPSSHNPFSLSAITACQHGRGEHWGVSRQKRSSANRSSSLPSSHIRLKDCSRAVTSRAIERWSFWSSSTDAASFRVLRMLIIPVSM